MVGASGLPPRFEQTETDAASEGSGRPRWQRRPKIVGVVQARLGSTRLPGKVLLPISGRPILDFMLERVGAARELDEIVVATTELPADEPIRALCAGLGVSCLSGHPTDLLDRHRMVGLARGADAIVKIPSDCPLIDPQVIDLVIGQFRLGYPHRAFVSNLQPPTWPDGNDVEVMHMDAVEVAWRLATRGFEREHTTPFIWDQPERFALENVVWPGGRNLAATHRLTLDYPEDFALISDVIKSLYRSSASPFSVEEIVAYLDARPEVRGLNAVHLGSSWMSRHADELRTLAPLALVGRVA